MDRALMDRFITIEMDALDQDMEYKLLKMKYIQKLKKQTTKK